MISHNKWLHTAAFILLVIGGLNWLLQGLFEREIGSLLGGMDALISRIIYILVGLSAIYEIATHGVHCKECKPEATPGMSSTGMGM